MYHRSPGSSPQNSPLLTQGTYSPSSVPTPVTPSTSNEYRWSDVVPPKTALKFAVVWDEEDIVGFSGGELLDDSRTEEFLLGSPISPSDACSQVLSVEPSIIPLSDKSSTLMYFREDMGSVLDPTSPNPASPRNRMLLSRTQTSSTLEGLDVYLRGSLLGQAHRNNRYYSCLGNLDGEFDFDPRTPFAKEYMRTAGKDEDVDDTVTDEGFYEVLVAPRQRHDSSEPSARRNLKAQSAYSASTTATSNFVSIDADDASSIWSTVEAPESILYTGFICMDQCPPLKKRLKKPRPANIPAPPSEVLQREVFSHQVSLPPQYTEAAEDTRSPQRKKSLVELVRLISKKNLKSAPVGDQWICVEVSHEVRQRFM